MKLWELDAICRHALCSSALEDTLSQPGWNVLVDQFAMIDAAVQSQNRVLLDQLLPPEFVKDVLQRVGGSIYSNGSQLRLYRFSSSDQLLTFLDIYLQFGGSALEEILEKGSLSVERAHQMNSFSP